MRRIVIAMQRLDLDVAILAAFTRIVDELASRFDEVAVIADQGSLDGRPPNVTLRRFGAPGRTRRLGRFLAALRAELARGADAFVAHQIPMYAVAAAPFARVRRVPILLWYAHPQAHRTLQLAERVSALVLSADERSFPLASPKVRAIGQAVDVAAFPPLPEHGETGVLRALALGRYSPAKGLPTIVEAVAAARAAGNDVTLALHGTASAGMEQAHRAELEALVRRLGLELYVHVGDAVPWPELPALFADTDVLVNNMRAGAADKVGFEAAAACLPVLASNPVYEGLLGGIEPALVYAREDPAELAERLASLAVLAPDERHRIGGVLRDRVDAGHSVRSWVDGLLAAVEEVRPSNR
jgi:glycosyltransferase involved in cell wall biosynthesis